VARLSDVLRRYHEREPHAAGMSLEEWRAALGERGVEGGRIASAVADTVLAIGAQAGLWEVAASVIRVTGWRPAVDSTTQTGRHWLLERLAAARWEIPTVRELERDLGSPVGAVAAGLVREGRLRQVDRERYADPEALQAFAAVLEATVSELGVATPAQLRDRLGLTRKYLIPLLEWADRQGVTRREGHARTLVRLTARSANR